MTGLVTPPTAVTAGQPAFLSDPTIARIGSLAKYALIAAVLTRAPGQALLGSVPFIGAPLVAAAGYVLVFGPFAIAVSIWWISFTFRGGPINPGGWTKGDLRFCGAVFAFPAIAAAFIAYQFFLLFAEPGKCDEANRLSYLFDRRLGGFQPEYCMGVSAEAAKSMPHLFYPLIVQAWAQVALPFIVAFLTWQLWRRWRGDTEQG